MAMLDGMHAAALADPNRLIMVKCGGIFNELVVSQECHNSHPLVGY